MKQKQFDEILEERIKSIRSVLQSKAKEYATGGDRLRNFKVAARFSSRVITPEQALWGMARKHFASVVDIIDLAAEGEFGTREFRAEKIGDAINYMILLEALLIESAPAEPKQVIVDGTCGSLKYKPV